MMKKSDYNWSDPIGADNNLVAPLREKGLQISKRDPFVGYSGDNDAKVSEANIILDNIDNPSYKKAIKSLLDSKSEPQIEPGDAEKAMQKSNIEAATGGDFAKKQKKEEKTPQAVNKNKKDTFLGMAKGTALTIGIVIIALIVGGIIMYKNEN